MKLDAIGFGSLNLDEIWKVPSGFLRNLDLVPGEEYVRDEEWFAEVYPLLQTYGKKKAVSSGGSAANMIAALFRMGFRTGFYGATGRKELQDLKPEELGRPEDVKIKVVSAPAGRCLVLINGQDDERDRALVLLPNANDLALADDVGPEYFLQARWIHLTSFVSHAPLTAQIRLVEELPRTIKLSLDPGAVYSSLKLAALEPLLRRADVVFITEEELQKLARVEMPGAVADLMKLGVGTVLVKLGPRGIKAFHEGEELYQPAAVAAQIRDRTGAGDVVAAAFLAGLLRSMDVGESLEFAAVAAARSIEGYGRMTYPDRDLFEGFASRRQKIRCSA